MFVSIRRHQTHESWTLISPVDCILTLPPAPPKKKKPFWTPHAPLFLYQPWADPGSLFQTYLPTPPIFYAAVKELWFPRHPWLSSSLHLSSGSKARMPSPASPPLTTSTDPVSIFLIFYGPIQAHPGESSSDDPGRRRVLLWVYCSWHFALLLHLASYWIIC